MITAKDRLEDIYDAIDRFGMEQVDLPAAAAMIRKEKEAQVTPPTTQTGTDIPQNFPTEPSKEPML